MALLGAALKAEIVEALGLDALTKELRREFRGVAKELQALKRVVRAASLASNRSARGGPGTGRLQVSSDQIRSARQALGESRKDFAARLGVSSGIVFAWETGRSAPRRKAILARLERVLTRTPGRGSLSSPAAFKTKRVAKLSAKRRASLKVQGQYMGLLRSLPPGQKAEVKAAKAARGFPEAIKLAKRLQRG